MVARRVQACRPRCRTPLRNRQRNARGLIGRPGGVDVLRMRRRSGSSIWFACSSRSSLDRSIENICFKSDMSQIEIAEKLEGATFDSVTSLARFVFTVCHQNGRWPSLRPINVNVVQGLSKLVSRPCSQEWVIRLPR
jgi:hypothetical protein